MELSVDQIVQAYQTSPELTITAAVAGAVIAAGGIIYHFWYKKTLRYEIRSLVREAVSEVKRSAEGRDVLIIDNIRLLSSADSRIRSAAIKKLAGWKHPAAIGPLFWLFQHPEYSSIYGAASALEKIGGERVEQLFIQALKHPHWEVRRQAVYFLGQMKAGSAVENLIPLLDDLDSAVRQQTIRVLGELQDVRALPVLKRAWETERNCEVAIALALLHDRNVVDYLIRLAAAYDDRKGASVITPWSQYISVNDISLRSISVLGELKEETATDMLYERLNSSSQEIRLAAVKALEKIGSQRSIVFLEERLSDLGQGVAEAAEEALRSLGINLEEVYFRLLPRATYYSVYGFVNKLLELGADQRRIADVLFGMYRANHSFDLYNAVKLLDSIGDNRTKEVLIEALKRINTGRRLFELIDIYKRLVPQDAEVLDHILERLKGQLPEHEIFEAFPKALRLTWEGYEFEIDYQEEISHEVVERYSPGSGVLDVEQRETIIDVPRKLEVNRGQRLGDGPLPLPLIPR